MFGESIKNNFGGEACFVRLTLGGWRILFRFSLFPWSSMNLVLDVFLTAPLEVGRSLCFVFVVLSTRMMA